MYIYYGNECVIKEKNLLTTYNKKISLVTHSNFFFLAYSHSILFLKIIPLLLLLGKLSLYGVSVDDEDSENPFIG